MNDSELDVEVDLEAIHSKRRKAFFDNEEEIDPKNNLFDSTGIFASHGPIVTEDGTRNPIEDLLNNPIHRPNGYSTTGYKLYHFWKGNNNFWLDGKFLNGLKKKSLKSRMALVLILASFCIYLIFPAFYLYDKISPFITLLTIYTFMLTMYFYFMTFRYPLVTQF